MYMEFTFTGDPDAIMERVVEDTRLERVREQDDLLQSVVTAQLREFHDQ
jgi:cell division control protein 6